MLYNPCGLSPSRLLPCSHHISEMVPTIHSLASVLVPDPVSERTGRVCAGVEACERRCVQPAGVERAACTGRFKVLSLGDQGETPFWDGRGDRQSLLGCLEWTTASCPGRPLHVHILEHPSPSTTVCQKLTTGPELRP